MQTENKSRTPKQRKRRSRRTAAAVPALFAFLVVLACGVSSACKPRQTEQQQSSPQAPVDPDGTYEAFTTFSQQITSSVHNLSVSPGETLSIPVTVKNTGNRRISSAGKFPVTFSYKWFAGGTMLQMEGERTVLPRPLNPGEEASFAAKVVAPPSGRDLTLKLTLVQEGVAWFMTSGATPLEIRVEMK